MRCKNCKKDIPDDSLYCPHCNADFSLVSENENNPLKFIVIILLLIIVVLVLTIITNNNIIPRSVYIEDGSNVAPSGSRTIMLYMDGSNLESNGSMATYELDSLDVNTFDFKNNHLLVYTGGAKKWHNFVSSEENAIYEFTQDKGFVKLESLSRLNMGSSETLSEFLTYGYKKYVTDSYNLIIWGHGGAINGAIYDEITGDHLDLLEFSKALKDSPFNTNNKLETVLFRTCLNGTFEMANIFKDYAKYLIASEEKTSGAYKSYSMSFLNKITRSDSAIDYGTKFIEQYANQLNNIKAYAEDNSVLDPMYSIVDLSLIDDINKEFDLFISSIPLEDKYNDIVRLRNDLFQFGYVYSDDPMYDTVDMYSLIEKLSVYTPYSSSKLLKLIDDAVVYNWTSIDESKGIAIYFPYNSTPKNQITNLTTYSELSYAKTYLSFIQDFRNKLVSNAQTSYKSEGLEHNKTSYNSEVNTLSLELTNDQVRDYLKSRFILLTKTSNGYAKVAYYSDNIIRPTEDDKTITAIVPNHSVITEANGKKIVIPLEERAYKESSVISTKVDLYADYKDGRYMYPGIINIEMNKDKPVISAVYIKHKQTSASSLLVPLETFDQITITENGYYIRDNKIINEMNETRHEIEIKKLKINYSDIKSEYYGVFVVTDIYGNSFYSNLINIQ